MVHGGGGAAVVPVEVDVRKMELRDKILLLENLLKVPETDNEKLLRTIRSRIDRVGIEIPKIEVRFQNLSIEGEAYIGTRALPTLLNSTLNAIEGVLEFIGLCSSKKKVVKILQDVSGTVKPSRLTLLLGPPGSGKTTLLKALAGKLDKNLKVSGKITYCGHEFSEFVPQRTSAYISQHDLHYGEMTVRETLEFSRRCLGVGSRQLMLEELLRREKSAGIVPDFNVDAFMKATTVASQRATLFTDYVLKILGLDICADTVVGDDMRRGISGGQKKRVTTGEMLTGPAKVFFMDEISTGLDSSTTYNIINFLKQIAHIMGETIVVSLLQPSPETFNLFDDIILLAESQIVYRGPKSQILQFFQSQGFECPDRKSVPDFIQEVTSKKDQFRYWVNQTRPYRFIPVPDFAKRTVQIGVMAVIASTVFLRSEMDPGEVGGVAKYGGALFFSLNNVLFNFLALFGIHQMSMSLYHFTGVLGRIEVIATTIATFALLIFFLLGGYIVAKYDIASWMRWCYYLSPVMYGQNAIAINEFLDERWNVPTGNASVPTIGMAFLNQKGMFTTEKWYWISMVALFGFTIFFNLIFILALKYLKRKSKSQGSDEYNEQSRKGMVLPFQPLSLVFNHVNYYVDMPSEMKSQEHGKNTRLQLLHDVSGAFRPCVLTALVGASGAGKTTLMDVLAGRKTGGYIEGSITISGYPKNQQTFARVSGYCEQNDIHSPYVTVYESLIFSAWLRLSSDISEETRKMFVEEVMELIELNPIRDALVGHPGVDGLSTEQRKRLTIAVELVANPSIIFMDEPTSGLDARAAAIVMRTVRNTVDTGRTVVCTIHQPSTDIFEAFDELLLMKRGGRVIYAGPLGHHSSDLGIIGVEKIREGYNPAAWMLEVTSTSVEAKLGIDYAELYTNSDLYKRNDELIKELGAPTPESENLHFPTRFSQGFFIQCKACFWKQHWSYWRNSQYNAIRFYVTIVIGLLFGIVFWSKGDEIHKEQDLLNLLGATYAAVLFLGASNAAAIQPVVSMERTVFYRERAAGMYSALPYAFAQVSDVSRNMKKFVYFYYFLFMCFTYFSTYGMMTVAVSPNLEIASIIMLFFTTIWNLFSGIFISKSEIPLWWRWYYWLCPLAWTIKGAFTSQFGDLNHLIEVSMSDPIPVDVFLEENFGYHSHSLGSVVLAHVGWVFLFIFVFAYSIKFLNFQKR
ncbi:Pleiotropic drug resistance protein 2 [Linum perenne]